MPQSQNTLLKEVGSNGSYRGARFGFAAFVLFAAAVCISAQEPYKLPSKEVVDILDAPPTPYGVVSPKGDLMLLVEYDPMPRLAQLAEPILGLAGIRLTAKTNARERKVFYTGLVIKRLEDGVTKRISLPEGAKLGFPEWSPDGSKFAFTRHVDEGIQLWVADSERAEARTITPPFLNTTLGSPFEWMPDSRHILLCAVPEHRGPPPEPPAVPIGPGIQETSGKFSKVRTYQDLLRDPHDEALFDYYATAQLVQLDVRSGKSRKIGTPGVYSGALPSPDGEFLLVRQLKRPYSYSVPYYLFPHSVEIWNMQGELVYQLADLPLADEVPIHGVRTGARSVQWRPLQPATLTWVEALDGGDPKRKVPHRDRLMTIAHPFETQPTRVCLMEHRYWQIEWVGDADALVTEYDWERRWRTTKLIRVDDPTEGGRIVFDLSVRDRYADPGDFVLKTTEAGERILLRDGDWVYLSGRGASPTGDRPFLDRMNMETLEKETLFRSGETSYESFVAFVGDERSRVVTRYESKTEPPNFFLRDLVRGDRRPLTHFEDPAPQLKGMTKRLVKYRREDGVPLSGTLYLPPGYEEGQRLPLVVWAYPLEYSDAATAGQVRGSPDRFTRFWGPSRLFFVTQGYAVLDNAQMPVIGDPETMNDTFIQQIVGSAKAAIDHLDSLGIIDPRRAGIGGHSYGAFMTANLLAHSDLFAAGIARSGAYNRTLTPFGFQSERRTLWEAPEVYIKVSPFLHADKINEPILLVHGAVDNNSGTLPIQSERLYHALKGHGATARWVVLPHESHIYFARESVLHVLAEMFDWFDLYVKNRQQ